MAEEENGCDEIYAWEDVAYHIGLGYTARPLYRPVLIECPAVFAYVTIVLFFCNSALSTVSFVASATILVRRMKRRESGLPLQLYAGIVVVETVQVVIKTVCQKMALPIRQWWLPKESMNFGFYRNFNETTRFVLEEATLSLCLLQELFLLVFALLLLLSFRWRKPSPFFYILIIPPTILLLWSNYHYEAQFALVLTNWSASFFILPIFGICVWVTCFIFEFFIEKHVFILVPDLSEAERILKMSKAMHWMTFLNMIDLCPNVIIWLFLMFTWRPIRACGFKVENISGIVSRWIDMTTLHYEHYLFVILTELSKWFPFLKMLALLYTHVTG